MTARWLWILTFPLRGSVNFWVELKARTSGLFRRFQYGKRRENRKKRGWFDELGDNVKVKIRLLAVVKWLIINHCESLPAPVDRSSAENEQSLAKPNCYRDRGYEMLGKSW